jgi:hypothetical protein
LHVELSVPGPQPAVGVGRLEVAGHVELSVPGPHPGPTCFVVGGGGVPVLLPVGGAFVRFPPPVGLTAVLRPAPAGQSLLGIQYGLLMPGSQGIHSDFELVEQPS